MKREKAYVRISMAAWNKACSDPAYAVAGRSEAGYTLANKENGDLLMWDDDRKIPFRLLGDLWDRG